MKTPLTHYDAITRLDMCRLKFRSKANQLTDIWFAKRCTIEVRRAVDFLLKYISRSSKACYCGLVSGLKCPWDFLGTMTNLFLTMKLDIS